MVAVAGSDDKAAAGLDYVESIWSSAVAIVVFGIIYVLLLLVLGCLGCGTRRGTWTPMHTDTRAHTHRPTPTHTPYTPHTRHTYA